jgi:hypothetical protein
VKDVLRGMEGTAFLSVPGTLARASVFAVRHFPSMSRAVGDARVRKAYVGPKTET